MADSSLQTAEVEEPKVEIITSDLIISTQALPENYTRTDKATPKPVSQDLTGEPMPPCYAMALRCYTACSSYRHEL